MNEKRNGLTYAQAGVDIDAGNRMVELIKPLVRATARPGADPELGAYLDPLADKVLIVSIYVSLGIADGLPRWLVILVVSRDLLIVGGVLFSWLLGKPVSVKPHPVSKVNTAVQLLLVGLVLAALGFGFDAGWVLILTMAAVAALTLASIAVYLREWVRHMGMNGIKR